jgi:hypothetical protein
VAKEFIYEDRALGKKDSRSGLDACLKALREGDTLVVWKLDRLGRDLHHLVSVVQELTERAVGLRVLAGQGALPWPLLAVADYESGYAAYGRGDYRTACRKWRPLGGQGDAQAQFGCL